MSDHDFVCDLRVFHALASVIFERVPDKIAKLLARPERRTIVSLFDQRLILEKELIEKAIKDANFHKALVTDPKGTIEKQFGVTLPNGLQISVHQEEPDHLHVVLPTGGTGTNELTMNDLTATSGWTAWENVTSCMLECTQCSNNETTCAPGPTEE